MAIKNHLKDIWYEILNGDINDAIGKFVTEMKNAMDSHVPLRRMSPQSKNIFMTPHCLKIKKQKKNLWNKYRKSGLARDLDAYESYRNKVRSGRRRLRGDFEGQIINNIKTKTKTFWKYVNSRLKSRVDIPSIILPDGSNAYSPGSVL